MLVQICCGVDCDYFFTRLKKDYPNDEIIGFFYDPNIHPYSEFLLRFYDVKRVCKKQKIKLIRGDYDVQSWLEGARGLENEPEKGERCSYCFDFRMRQTAILARDLGQNLITTTLFMSPKKDFSQLRQSLERICTEFGLEFITPDFRKNGGTSEQMELARADKLYKQNYCGCLFALNSTPKPALKYELCETIGRQIQPGSIQYRLKIYKKAHKFEKNNINFEIYKIKILNYRLEIAKTSYENSAIDSYFCFYSTIKNQRSKLSLKSVADVVRAQRDGVIFLSLAKFNDLGKFNYKSVRKLCQNPPKLKAEMRVRKALCGEFSLNALVVLDEIKTGKYELFCQAQTFESEIEKIAAVGRIQPKCAPNS